MKPATPIRRVPAGRIFKRVLLFSLLISATARASAIGNPEASADWTEIQSLLANFKGVTTNPPQGMFTGKFTTGLLMGNGDIGVTAGDTTNTQQTFQFNKGDFVAVYYNTSKSRWENSVLPAGSLVLSSPTIATDAAGPYRLEQDILKAEVHTTLKLGEAVVQMRSWTADSENTFVTEFSTAPGSSPVTLAARLQEPANDAFPHTSGVTQGILWVTRENDNRTDVKARVALAMKLIGGTWNLTTNDGAGVTGNFTLQPVSPVRLVVAIQSDTKLTNACSSVAALRDAAIRRAAGITLRHLGRLESGHQDWWKNYWLKSFIRVHDDVLEKYYYGALYCLGSAARPGRTLPSMWGLWMTSDQPAWGGRHFFNYNAQGPYYGVSSANRPELILPYSEFVMAELPYQINATHAAGYVGTTFRRSYAPFDLFRPRPALAPVASVRDYKRLQTDQKSNGGFAAVLLIEYYDYTRDKAFLKEKLYPLLKELDAFWRDFMERDELPGGGYRYVIRHTGAHEVTVAEDVNPNLDVGYIRMVCRALIADSQELGVDAGLIPVWQDVLDHLSQYPTGIYDGKECFQECEVRNGGSTDPARLMHRMDQPINMEGAVHPGENVTLGGDPHWIQVGLNTYSYMDAWGLSGRPMNNAFCKVWPQAVRLGWPAGDFFNKFKASIGTLWRDSNLTCFQGGGGIETCGSVDAVNSMLLQSNFEELRLFPVWPKDREASFKRLRAKGAFVVSSEFKNGRVSFIDVVSEKGRPLKIINPWSDGVVTVVETGGLFGKHISHSTNANVITLDTKAGRRYFVTGDRR